MPYEPDPETAIRVGWAVTLLGVIIFIVSALGEYLGWWDLVGETGMLVGTVLSIVVGFGTWFSSAGRRQLAEVGGDVRSVHGAVVENGIQLRKLDKLEELDGIQAELDAQTGVLGEQLSVLSEIRDGVA